MDQTALVEEDVEAGRRAAEAFDASGPQSKAILWLYEPDAGEWRLIVGTPVVDEEGPRAAVSKISKALETHDLMSVLPLRRVSAVGMRTPLIRALRKVVRTRSDLSGIRFTNNVINGLLIHDAYIYRMQ